MDGGDDGIRTHDPLLAGQVLSQLSYTPIFMRLFASLPYFSGFGNGFTRSLTCVSIELSSRAASRKVFSPLQSLTSVFGMGTGGPSALKTLTYAKFFLRTFGAPSGIRTRDPMPHSPQAKLRAV